MVLSLNLFIFQHRGSAIWCVDLFVLFIFYFMKGPHTKRTVLFFSFQWGHILVFKHLHKKEKDILVFIYQCALVIFIMFLFLLFWRQFVYSIFIRCICPRAKISSFQRTQTSNVNTPTKIETRAFSCLFSKKRKT